MAEVSQSYVADGEHEASRTCFLCGDAIRQGQIVLDVGEYETVHRDCLEAQEEPYGDITAD